jgi:hypothetical protein
MADVAFGVPVTMDPSAEVGDGGDYGRYAARKLAELLTRQGRGEEAERLRRFGLNPDGSTASVLGLSEVMAHYP